jgi:DNA-binding CsgD family transcriptional regulator
LNFIRAAPPGLERVYREYAHKCDSLPHINCEDGRVYALCEVLDLADPVHCDFFRKILVPRGMMSMRTMRLIEPSGTSTWLSIARESRDFDGNHDAMLRSLAPHLRRALRSYLAIDRARFSASVTADALRRLNCGWVTLDASCNIMEMSVHAEEILRQSSAIARSGANRLMSWRASVSQAVAEAVAGFAQDSSMRPRALHISHDPWVDMLLVPVQIQHQPASARPVAIAYIQGDHRTSADRHVHIAELFGLTPSESSLALALSRGRSIAEAAVDLGLSVETARSYSKRIYAKTGARGQVDLVRFILASALALA